jgi:hypothetical protein
LIHRNKSETKLHYADRLIWHGKTALRWLKTHKRLITAKAGPSPYNIAVRDHRWELRYGLRLKHEIYIASLPTIAHRSLWLCLHPHESSNWYDRDSGGNSHYGGLQMTKDWMGIIKGYPYFYSPEQQMNAAETGYRNSGYSRAWLWGQWGQTLGFCTRYI